MFARYLILGLLLVAFMSPAAFADSGFCGTITYEDCDCTDHGGDFVRIVQVSTSDTTDCHSSCKHGGGYNTSGCTPSTFPQGWYSLWVVTIDDCAGPTAYVLHSGIGGCQEVNLTVWGLE